MSLTGPAPQPALAWQFESSNVDVVTGLAPNLATTGTYAAPTGGTITTIANKRIHTFTSVGTTTITFLVPVTAQVLVVAGGGGAGQSDANYPGGGGGAGEVYSNTMSFNPGTYTISVGGGGSGSGSTIVRPANGSDSSIKLNTTTIVSVNGGGGGGNGNNNLASPNTIYQQPQNGGSGGGTGRHSNANVVRAISVLQSPGGLGNSGGFTGTSVNTGSGGGGAGSAGSAGVNNGSAGAGGSGFVSSISGTSVTYGKGGGGGSYNTGGSGANGASGTGNGGDGADGISGGARGGNGGSGIVIISYNAALYPAPTYVPGIYGQAINFNNTLSAAGADPNCYVTYDVSSFNFTSNSAAMSLWLNSGLTYPIAIAGSPAYINLQGSFYNNLLTESTSLSNISCRIGSRPITVASKVAQTGVWNHHCIVFSNVNAETSNTITSYYVNGALLGSANNTIQNFTTLNLGCQNSGGYGALCSIDDLRIYNTALSAAQVQSIYNARGMPNRGVQVNTIGTNKTIFTRIS